MPLLQLSVLCMCVFFRLIIIWYHSLDGGGDVVLLIFNLYLWRFSWGAICPNFDRIEKKTEEEERKKVTIKKNELWMLLRKCLCLRLTATKRMRAISRKLWSYGDTFAGSFIWRHIIFLCNLFDERKAKNTTTTNQKSYIKHKSVFVSRARQLSLWIGVFVIILHCHSTYLLIR